MRCTTKCSKINMLRRRCNGRFTALHQALHQTFFCFQCVIRQVQRCNGKTVKLPHMRASAYARAHTCEAFCENSVAPLHLPVNALILLDFWCNAWCNTRCNAQNLLHPATYGRIVARGADDGPQVTGILASGQGCGVRAKPAQGAGWDNIRHFSPTRNLEYRGVSMD